MFWWSRVFMFAGMMGCGSGSLEVVTDDADTDTDTDTDTDVDTDTDADADADCGREDLIFSAESRDATGACTVCNGKTVVFRGLVTNPCSKIITFNTNTSCLVSDWTLVNLSTGKKSVDSQFCTGTAKELDVLGGEFVYETIGISPLEDGEYSLEVQFDDWAGHSEDTTLTVEN